jgi:hypothetical protein
MASAVWSSEAQRECPQFGNLIVLHHRRCDFLKAAGANIHRDFRSSAFRAKSEEYLDAHAARSADYVPSLVIYVRRRLPLPGHCDCHAHLPESARLPEL